MPARKRAYEELQVELPAPDPTPSILLRLRNLWEFACLMQYIYLFGDAVKIDKEVDIDFLESECMKPTPSGVLSEIGLALLKNVSSHRGLTPDLFDEYTRRQYLAKAPDRNPFGQDEEPRKFADFDTIQKIRVLHQLSVWTLHNPDRIRQYYADDVVDQTTWRIEELGWDKQDRSYFVLDDNRLYRSTKPTLAQQSQRKPKAKAEPKPKPQRPKGSRSSKRQKLANGYANESEPEEDHANGLAVAAPQDQEQDEDNGLGGAKWECIAITLEEYNTFLDTIRKSKDSDEKALVNRITEEVLPELEKHAAAKERKLLQQQKELINLQKLATAKRSSRLADKHERLREQQEAEEEERRKREELAMALREQEKQRKREEARESRMQTREQRLRERETKRILHEEELRKLEEQEARSDSGDARVSERKRKLEMQKQRQELEKWSEAEDEWYFDCSVCGKHGKNLDDGTHSIACERCNVWQHSACHSIKEDEAERDDFHFVCQSCKHPIKLRITSPHQRASIPATGAPEIQNTNLQPKDAKNSSRPVGLPRSQPPLYNWSTIQTPTSISRPQVNGTHLLETQSRSQLLPTSHGHSPTDDPIHKHPPPNSSALAHGNFLPLESNHHSQQILASGAPKHQQSSPLKLQSPVTGYNPHHNDFGKERQYFNANRTPSASRQSSDQSSIHNAASPNPSQVQNQPPSSASPIPPSSHHQYKVVATPHSSFQSHLSTPHISASPTPSLSATQGSTSVRFSPTTQRSVTSTNAYIPNNNQPSPAAYSPIKQTSPRPTSSISEQIGPVPHSKTGSMATTIPVMSSPKAAVAGTNAHIPTLQSSSPNVTNSNAGISPVKHDVPTTQSPTQIRGLGLDAPILSIPSLLMNGEVIQKHSIAEPQFNSARPRDGPTASTQGLNTKSSIGGEEIRMLQSPTEKRLNNPIVNLQTSAS